MQSELRAALVHLCRRVLHPLIRILVRFGVSAGELKAIIDSVYAHAGAEYLEQQGERVTYSRLAVITGINRSALPEILAAPQARDFQPRSTTQLHRAARVLTGWYDDRDFLSRDGRPAALPIHGNRRSFRQLVHRYSGGMYYQTILSELERLGAVKRVDAETVRAVRRTPSAGGASPESVYSAGELAGDLMETLGHNLAAGPDEQLPVRSLTLEADARSLPLYRAQMGRRADALLEQVESFLEAHPPAAAATGRRRARRAGSGTAAGAGAAPAADEASSGRLSMGAAVFAFCRPSKAPARRTALYPKPRPRRTA